jgi:CheY-like chemotaxis protein
MSAILLVDDSFDDSDMLRRGLFAIGVRNTFRVVTSCSDAISYLQADNEFADRKRFPLPSVIFLDLNFPGMDGFQFLKWIREHPEFNGILVIAVSGYEDLRRVHAASQAGASSFVLKPCGRAELENLIEKFPGRWEFAKSAVAQ